MNRTLPSVCLGVYAIIVCGCSHRDRQAATPVPEHYINVPDSVAFDIAPLDRRDASARWMATYAARGKTAKFIIEFGASKRIEDSAMGPMSSGNGRFESQPDSDASALLEDLKVALHAKRLSAKVRRVDELPFDFVNLGEDYSQSPDGGFSAKPPGNWMPTKIFLGEGEHEGEVFLNLNPTLLKGQFSIKDEDYGDDVLAQLAKVL